MKDFIQSENKIIKLKDSLETTKAKDTIKIIANHIKSTIMKITKLPILFIFCTFFAFSNGTIEPAEISKTEDFQTYKFVLTHLLGKKLETAAHFSVGNQKVWKLDFRNGKKINYTIVSMNEDNPMCGISANDSFGDDCEICITKTSGDNTKIEFKYNGKRLTYTGYISR